MKAATTKRPLSSATTSKKVAAITPSPAANPSMMSTRLKALDNPTSHSTVMIRRTHHGMKATWTMIPAFKSTKTATT